MTPREKIEGLLVSQRARVSESRQEGYDEINIDVDDLDKILRIAEGYTGDEIKDGPSENDINTIKKLRRLSRIQELNGYQVSDILRIAAKYMGIE